MATRANICLHNIGGYTSTAEATKGQTLGGGNLWCYMHLDGPYWQIISGLAGVRALVPYNGTDGYAVRAFLDAWLKKADQTEEGGLPNCGISLEMEDNNVPVLVIDMLHRQVWLEDLHYLEDVTEGTPINGLRLSFADFIRYAGQLVSTGDQRAIWNWQEGSPWSKSS